MCITNNETLTPKNHMTHTLWDKTLAEILMIPETERTHNNKLSQIATKESKIIKGKDFCLALNREERKSFQA